jgi:hypothetical protein
MAAVTHTTFLESTSAFQDADLEASSEIGRIGRRSIRTFPGDGIEHSRAAPVISDFHKKIEPEKDPIEYQIRKVYRSIYDEKEIDSLVSIYLKTKNWPLGMFVLGGRTLSHAEIAENFGLIREDALGHIQYGSILAICGWTIQKNLVFLLGGIKRKADFHIYRHPGRFIVDGYHPAYWKTRNEATTFAIELAVLMQTGYKLTDQGKENGLWLVLRDEKLAEDASLHTVRTIKENLTPKILDLCLKANWKGPEELI